MKRARTRITGYWDAEKQEPGDALEDCDRYDTSRRNTVTTGADPPLSPEGEPHSALGKDLSVKSPVNAGAVIRLAVMRKAAKSRAGAAAHPMKAD